MSTTTHQGAEGAETMTAGQTMVLLPMDDPGRPLNDSGLPSVMIWAGGEAYDNLTADKAIDLDSCSLAVGIYRAMTEAHAREIATLSPAPRTDGGMTAGEDGAWPFERTRTYLLAELERLRADLHTIGEDLTGEQGKAASWLDVATGRVANVSSVLASATPAQPAGAVPDSLREAIAFAAAAEGAKNGPAARRYAALRCLQWVETLLSPQADKQTETPTLRAVVEVYPDRTDTRLTFGDRIRPELSVKAVEQAIAALTAEYEARGGCPVVGRFPAGQSAGPALCSYVECAALGKSSCEGCRDTPRRAGQSAGSGAETDDLVDRFSAALKVKLRAAEAKYGWKNGWLKSDWQVECQNGLLRHVGKGDPLDVAAYAAFCWHHGWPSASRRSTDLVTGAVIPTAGAIAAYETRYPDGSLSETSDNTIEAWNRVAAAVCLAEKPAPDSTRTGQGEAPWPEQYVAHADGYGPIEEWRDWTKQAGREPLSDGALHALRGMVGE